MKQIDLFASNLFLACVDCQINKLPEANLVTDLVKKNERSEEGMS